jgi:hypothetical protein
MRRITLLLAALLQFLGTAPAFAADSRELLSLLKTGSYVIIFRHGATDDSQKDIYPFRFDDMKAQRQLSEKGRKPPAKSLLHSSRRAFRSVRSTPAGFSGPLRQARYCQQARRLTRWML